jgi:uncharacterized protein (DUF952 family)
MDRLVYKIVPRMFWEAAEATGVFAGASVDFEDGFIHLSSGKQVKETARLYFAGQNDLLLVGVETAALGEALKWEASRGGDLFPHLYAPLEFSAVDFVVPLPLGPDGAHRFPDDLESGQ